MKRLLRQSRRSNLALAALAALAAVFVWTFADAARLREQRAAARELRSTWAAHWLLTDLCIFTDARYTRHPTQADWHSPFQDHPGASEHFPSGSLVRPPRLEVKPDATPD